MSMRKSIILLVGLFSFSMATADSVKIGFNVPLIGFAAADGNSAKIGAELAVEQANADRGIDSKTLIWRSMMTKPPAKKPSLLPIS